MSRDLDVVVVGGGVIGAVMAAALLARKVVKPGRIAIVDASASISDASPSADWDLRVFALSRASERLLRVCGIWNALPPGRRFAYERMRVWEAGGTADGPGSLHFDCADMGEPNLGFIVDGKTLQTAARRAALDAGASLVSAGVDSVALTSEDIEVSLDDGRRVRSKLLVVADGMDSKTRGLLGIRTAGHLYHQDALVAHVRTSLPHRTCAWQRFLSTGPLAFLPLPDGRSSIVWSVSRPEATRLRALDDRAFSAALTEASAGVLGECELTTPIASFPLKLQYALDYVRPRAVLLGDAAHAVHPLAGQGLNLGLLDCAALAEVLADGDSAGLGEYRILRRYERWRRSENLSMAAALDGLERVFSTTHPALAALRTMGLGVVGKSAPLKQALVRRAMGLSGDVPSFLKIDPT